MGGGFDACSEGHSGVHEFEMLKLIGLSINVAIGNDRETIV